MRFQITKDRRRQISASVLAVLCIVIFSIYPDAFSALTALVPVYAAYFLPLVALLALACLLVEVESAPLFPRAALKLAAALGCLLAVLYGSEALAGRHFWYLARYHWQAFAYSYALLLFISVLLFALTGSLPWAIRGTAIVAAVHGLVAYFVMQFRGTAFVPMDIAGAGTALDVLPGYTFSFSRSLAEGLLAFLCVFLIAPRLRLPRARRAPVRWGMRAAALAFAAGFVFTALTKEFINQQGLQPNYWVQARSVEDNGNLVNFVANIIDARIETPEGYSLEAVQAIAGQYTSDSIADAGVKPDVVLILGESWADLTPAGSVRTNNPVIPFMQSLAQQGNAGGSDLIVSTVGGGTSRSEFQVLTGANVVYGMHGAPFQASVTEPIPSIVSSFKQLGYQAIAMHTGTAGAWGREEAFPVMGFDSFITFHALREDNPRWIRDYMRDEALYNRALEVLDAAEEPTFIYAITIAAHGGYAHPDYNASIQIEQPEGSFPQTEQYLSVLHESDHDLEAFIGALASRERPTLVLFFGDHLPYVDEVYMDEILDTGDVFWRYRTFFGAWANYPLPEEAARLDALPTFSIGYLGTYLLRSAGLPMTGYQKFMEDWALRYPVVSVAGFMDAQGTAIPVSSARDLDVYGQQAIMQYNFVMDRENLAADFFYLQP